MNLKIVRKTTRQTGFTYYEIRSTILFFFTVLYWFEGNPCIYDTEDQAIDQLHKFAKLQADQKFRSCDMNRRFAIGRAIVFILLIILAASWLNKAKAQDVGNPCADVSRFAPAGVLEATTDPGFIFSFGLHAYKSNFSFFAGIQSIAEKLPGAYAASPKLVPRFEMLYRLVTGLHAYAAILPGAGHVSEGKTSRTDPIGAGLVYNYQIGPWTAVRIRAGYEGHPIFGLGLITLFKR